MEELFEAMLENRKQLYKGKTFLNLAIDGLLLEYNRKQ